MKKNLILLRYMIIIFSFISNVYGQTIENVHYENDVELYNHYTFSMGGASVTNFINPACFIDNPALMILSNTSEYYDIYISGIEGRLIGSNSDKFYPFFDYDSLESLSNDKDYLKEFQSLSGSYGYSGPIKFMFLSNYFSLGVFTGLNFSMDYESKGIPPELNFTINTDFMSTFSANLPFEFSLFDNPFLISVGIRVKYIQRDKYYSKITDFTNLTEFKDDDIGRDTYVKITNGYIKLNSLGFDLGFLLKYDFMLFGLSYKNVSLPYAEYQGTIFSAKEYDVDDKELPVSEYVYLIPSTINISLSISFERLNMISFIKDLYFGIDLTNICLARNYSDKINIGMHFTLFNIARITAGTDIKNITLGLLFNIFNVDIGVSYNLKFLDYNEINYIGFILSFHI